MSARNRYGLFDVFGVEIEEMIVDSTTLDVRPFADRVLVDPEGAIVSDIRRGPITWCNELMAHAIELKNEDPVPALDGLVERFDASITEIDGCLRAHGARLMPSGLHPWMNPRVEAQLWPHECNEIYAAFDAIFDCRGHGWANVQSVQINLPFADDEEFGRLHAAIRLLLPLLPALTAGTPFVEGVATGCLDNRMRFYRTNCARVPAVTGLIVPEDWRTRAAYEAGVFDRIHREIAPLDASGVLQREWVNARGAIARFERGAIEIRILDTQECPLADVAVLAAIVDILRDLIATGGEEIEGASAFETERLAGILGGTIDGGDLAPIEDGPYLAALGLGAGRRLTGREAWRELIDRSWRGTAHDAPRWRGALDTILDSGCLARRILRATGTDPDRDRIRAVYRQLADCLIGGRVFDP